MLISEVPAQESTKRGLQPLGQSVPGKFPDLLVAGVRQAKAQSGIIDQALDLPGQEPGVGKGDDEGGLFMNRKIAGAAGRADDGKPASHGLGGCVGPAGASLGAGEHIGLGEEPGHPGLGKVEIELGGHGCLDERAGITSIPADQAVEKNQKEMRIPSMKLLDGLDHLPDALSLLVDSAITENLEFPARIRLARIGLSSNLSLRKWRRRFRLRQPKKYLRIYSARRSETAAAVFPLDPPADAFRISQQVITTPGDFFFLFMALEHEVEAFRPGLEGVELFQDGILAAESDVEFGLRNGLKGPDLSPVLQPIRLLPCRGEKCEAMTSSGQRVADLEIAADAAEDFHVGKERRDPHLRMNLPCAVGPVKRVERFLH